MSTPPGSYECRFTVPRGSDEKTITVSEFLVKDSKPQNEYLKFDPPDQEQYNDGDKLAITCVVCLEFLL